MVAKSYQELEVVGEVFTVSGRQYINVKLKSGKTKSVRWYSDKEYAKLYPSESSIQTNSYFKPQKDILGFKKGYITIFKGNTEDNDEWFRNSNARYCRFWGWYIISEEEVPENLPFRVQPVRLDWNLVGFPDGALKPERQIKGVIDSIIYESTGSEYVGQVGQRIEVSVVIERAIPIEGAYGTTTLHIMRSVDGNLFAWNTKTKSWPVGSTHHIKGTIKEHKVWHNDKQTWLTRCSEV